MKECEEARDPSEDIRGKTGGREGESGSVGEIKG